MGNARWGDAFGCRSIIVNLFVGLGLNSVFGPFFNFVVGRRFKFEQSLVGDVALGA